MTATLSLSQRAAGALLHLTSLPGPHGSGDMGESAQDFAEFLNAAGVRWWHMLPITPIGPGNSPYSSPSAFAGNPLLIDLGGLVQLGLIRRGDLRPPDAVEESRVRFPAMIRFRVAALRRAFGAFGAHAAALRDDFERFCGEQSAWLDDFALFGALQRAHRGKPWVAWPAEVRQRRPAALRAARSALRDEYEFQRFTQFLFDAQWRSLRSFCHALGVGLIGDLPIFVTHDSADVWANRELFRLDRFGRPTVVTGCPPDNFSRTGQLWGHPHYAWAAHARSGFAWWIARVRTALARFDAVRIDHFLGFHQAWEVPAAHRTAARGVYGPSPGDRLLGAMRRALPQFEVVAEDLGNVTPGAVRLREKHGLPGMRILQNAFGDGARYDQPHNYPRDCVAFTGTHDNDTLVGWMKEAQKTEPGRATLRRALGYCGASGSRDLPSRMIRALYQSPASTVVVPVQDWLELDNRARMNTPATARGNWEWRLRARDLRPGLAARFRSLAETYERI